MLIINKIMTIDVKIINETDALSMPTVEDFAHFQILSLILFVSCTELWLTFIFSFTLFIYLYYLFYKHFL